MKYVIWNADQKKYVAPAGARKSFVRSILDARRFDSKEAAERDACGNERIRPLNVEY